MSTSSKGALEALLCNNELKWMVDAFESPEKAMEVLEQGLREVNREARSRFGDIGPQLTAEMLADEESKNPHKVRAFLQALGAGWSPPMLVMVWQILQGMRIQEVDLQYREGKSFLLRVVLNSPYEDKPQEYESDDIRDTPLLGHFGTMRFLDAPVFGGFYPLRLS